MLGTGIQYTFKLCNHTQQCDIKQQIKSFQLKMSYTEPFHKMRAPSGTRDFSVCKNQKIFLAVVYDTVRIYQVDLKGPIVCIKLDSTPRSAKLSQCGKYFFIHDSSNIIYLYDTRSGNILQQIVGVPLSIKTIKFSKNSQKLIYASTQMLCLWNIRKCTIDMRTQHWKNINCYDIGKEGTQFAIGTYSGIIYVLDFIQVGKCSQIQIKRHKTCVAAICCHENQVISASHDGYFLISTITKDSNAQRIIAYNQMKLKSIPKEMESIGNNFYMFNNQGMTWFNLARGFNLTGFTDYKIYRPYTTEQGKTFFVSLYSGQMQWWPSNVFKTVSQIEREKAEKAEKQRWLKERQAHRSSQGGKQNRVVYKVVYKR